MITSVNTHSRMGHIVLCENPFANALHSELRSDSVTPTHFLAIADIHKFAHALLFLRWTRDEIRRYYHANEVEDVAWRSGIIGCYPGGCTGHLLRGRSFSRAISD